RNGTAGTRSRSSAASAVGSFQLTLDLTSIPTPGGATAVLPGETWFFQA
ncbi:MAG: hypothetical protein ACJAQ3_004297, partial [Planctomycetota bacterium]